MPSREPLPKPKTAGQPIPLRGTIALSLKAAAASNTVSTAPAGEQVAAAEGKTGGEISDKDSADYKLRRLQELSLNERATAYSEQATGPVQPGYNFYKMLGMGPPLQVPIPDSILVDKMDIRRLRSDKRGFVVLEKPTLLKQEHRDAFMLSCIESFVAESVPFGQQPHMVDLKNRFVAVRKQPCAHSKALVANTTELLTPLALQTSILEYMDTLQGSCMLQKFVKGRGLKASVVRVFWRATACGARPSGAVSGWFLTQKDKKFACFKDGKEEEESPGKGRPKSASAAQLVQKERLDKEREAAAAAVAAAEARTLGQGEHPEEDEDEEEEEETDKSVAWRRRHAAKLAHVLSSKQIADNLSSAAAGNAAFLEHMCAHPDISATEQSLAKAASSIAHKAVGAHNIVSITGDRGTGVTPEAMREVSCMRVGRRALILPHLYMERLISWVQNVMQLTSDVRIHLSDAVCDFVRDDKGDWWLLQLKGFRISPLSRQRCLDWYNERAFGLARAKKATPSEQRAKLDAERGYKCKLCGLNFQEGQMVEVEDAAPQPLSPGTALPSRRTQRPSLNTVPAYGYELSRRMACRISEIYRDASFPLTKFSRAVLTGEAHVMEARSVVEKLRELEVLELKRSTGGELSCCYLCFQNMEEYQRVQDRCQEIYDLVRADSVDLRGGGLHRKEKGKEKGKGKGKGEGAAKEDPGDKDGDGDGDGDKKRVSARGRPRSASPSRPSAQSRRIGAEQDPHSTLSVSASVNFADGLKLREVKKDPAIMQAAAARALIAGVNSLYRRNHDGSYTSGLRGTLKPATRPDLDLPSVKRELSLRWTDIPRRSAQWRILIAVHYIADATLPAAHPLRGAVGCLSYSLGQSVSVLPFINLQRGGEFTRNPLIMVQQMRVHYLFGTLQDVKEYLAEKKLDVEVCFQPPDDTAGEAAAAGAASRMPRLESRFQIGLDKLSLTTSGLQDGSLKEDYKVPLIFESMEPALLRLSVAIVKDDALPPQIAEVGALLREKAVFWPPPPYHDSAPLPQPWLGVLSLATSHSGRNTSSSAEGASAQEKLPEDGVGEEGGHHSTSASAAASVAGEAVQRSKTEDEILKDEGLPAARALVRDTFAALVMQHMDAASRANEQAGAKDAAKEDEFSALLNKPAPGFLADSAAGKSGRGRSRDHSKEEEEEEEDEWGEEGDNFGDEEKQKPAAKRHQAHHTHGKDSKNDDEEASGSASSGDEYDFDDELPTYEVIKSIFQAIRRAEEEPVDSIGARGADGKLNEGFQLMRLAVEQILQAESLPEIVSLTNFSYILEECLSWARTQRMILRSAAKEEEQDATKDNIGTMSRTRYLSAAGKLASHRAVAKAAETAEQPRIELGMEWVISTEKLIYSYKDLYPNSDLDVSFSQGELTQKTRIAKPSVKLNAAARRASTAAPPDDKTAKFEIGVPSSEKRKLRRFMLALSLFDLVGGGDESIDVAQLRSHLLLERDRLRKALSMANEGAANWPVLKRDFHLHLTSVFLQERAILAMHLLRYSDSLQQLFDTFDEHGTASLSRTGFLVASEECFRGVTQRRQLMVSDAVTEELEAFCTDKSMQAQSNNTSLRRNTFHLGSTDWGDLSTLGARRRQSTLGASGSKSSNEPPTLWVRCDEHGIEKVFAADFMCVKCEEEHHGYVRDDEYVQVQVQSATELSVLDERPQQGQGQGRKGSVRRKSSFAFH